MLANKAPDLEALCEELRERHGCHTAILYGSRARGDETADSDYDAAGFASVEIVMRDARPWRGTYLDVFVYPQKELEAPTQELLKLRGGRVLFEREEAGTRLLARLEEVFAAGPAPLSADEMQVRRTWARKMLARIARGDIEGDYRRAWLLTALLQDYFELRGLWFAGPKEGLAWLAINDPGAYAAFEAALKPGAGVSAIARAVGAVVG
jgi:hypothetical protein